VIDVQVLHEASLLKRTAFGATDIGRRRVSNEDAWGLDEELGLYVVADGMGGHAAGEVASREAVDTVIAMVRRERDTVRAVANGDRSPDALRKLSRVLEAAIQAATYMVFAIAENEPEQRGMGTTLSALCVASDVGCTAQVGDSRVYKVRAGEVERLTEDHTLVAWQLKQGIISEAEAERSPHKNVITRAVGSRDYVQVDTRTFEIKPGDRYLLCSDGLHGYLVDPEIAPILAKPAGDAVKELIDLANTRGGRDNITAIIVAMD
jgi:serine/threonine protein phosphatase PrpC